MLLHSTQHIQCLLLLLHLIHNGIFHFCVVAMILVFSIIFLSGLHWSTWKKHKFYVDPSILFHLHKVWKYNLSILYLSYFLRIKKNLHYHRTLSIKSKYKNLVGINFFVVSTCKKIFSRNPSVMSFWAFGPEGSHVDPICKGWLN